VSTVTSLKLEIQLLSNRMPSESGITHRLIVSEKLSQISTKMKESDYAICEFNVNLNVCM